VRVTAAVPSAEESKALFGVPLYKKGIQPVWLEIENHDEKALWFLPASVDRDYFAPLEVAYVNHFPFAGQANETMDRFFHDSAIGKYVAPGATISGFVFTHVDLGTKAFNVDLVSKDHDIRTFTFFVNVPGLKPDHSEVDWARLYSADEVITCADREQLRSALQSLPRHVTDSEGLQEAEPLNLVLIGRGESVLRALLQSGWDETESAVAPETQAPLRFWWQYRHRPVRRLYCYGRPQDASFRKSRATVREQNTLRLWLTPVRAQGEPVWVGQASRYVTKGVLADLASLYQLESDVDEARTYVLQDLWYTQSLAAYAHLECLDEVPISEPRENLDGEAYFTDGFRVVLWISSDPVSFSEVQRVDWDTPPER
jgi:hypothetical protein